MHHHEIYCCVCEPKLFGVSNIIIINKINIYYSHILNCKSGVLPFLLQISHKKGILITNQNAYRSIWGEGSQV